MGSSIGKIMSTLSKQKDTRILLTGLDAAGKTTILYATKLGEIITTIPTIGFNVETVEYKNLTFIAWDVGGRDKIRPLWRHYLQNMSAIVFVVDSNDAERMEDAKEELHRLASEDELQNAAILVLANKQDLPNALSLEQIKEKLDLSKFDKRNIKWHIQATIATQREGIEEGFKWLAEVSKPETNLKEPIIETVKDSVTMKNDLLNAWNSIDWKSLTSKFI
ncbi:hypothetical protein I4U23_028649 [Adineta vaga]|nr:hypothetical protein I4U23_028649 [Adineta vaga]